MDDLEPFKATLGRERNFSSFFWDSFFSREHYGDQKPLAVQLAVRCLAQPGRLFSQTEVHHIKSGVRRTADHDLGDNTLLYLAVATYGLSGQRDVLWIQEGGMYHKVFYTFILYQLIAHPEIIW